MNKILFAILVIAGTLIINEIDKYLKKNGKRLITGVRGMVQLIAAIICLAGIISGICGYELWYGLVFLSLAIFFVDALLSVWDRDKQK